MNKRIAVALLVVSISTPSFADFSSVARALESRLGSRTWIPFLGFARMVVRASHPRGVHDFQVAIFEGRNEVLSGSDVEKILRASAGKGFAPIVKVYSARKGEWSFIYARPSAEQLVELLIVAHEDKETVVVRVVADASRVMRDLGQPVRVSMIGRN